MGDPIHRALRGGTQQASLLHWAGGFGLILTSGFKSGKLFNYSNGHKWKGFLQWF